MIQYLFCISCKIVHIIIIFITQVQLVYYSIYT